jgi:hypothetical protein
MRGTFSDDSSHSRAVPKEGSVPGVEEPREASCELILLISGQTKKGGKLTRRAAVGRPAPIRNGGIHLTKGSVGG